MKSYEGPEVSDELEQWPSASMAQDDNSTSSKLDLAIEVRSCGRCFGENWAQLPAEVDC